MCLMKGPTGEQTYKYTLYIEVWGRGKGDPALKTLTLPCTKELPRSVCMAMCPADWNTLRMMGRCYGRILFPLPPFPLPPYYSGRSYNIGCVTQILAVGHIAKFVLTVVNKTNIQSIPPNLILVFYDFIQSGYGIPPFPHCKNWTRFNPLVTSSRETHRASIWTHQPTKFH